MRDHDFIIFSLYVSLGSSVLNSVYLVSKNQWFFDFKRTPSVMDEALVGSKALSVWRLNAKLDAKRSVCIRAGSSCIRNLYLFICADITSIFKERLSDRSLIFIPANMLPASSLSSLYRYNAHGHVFINDPVQGVIWDIPLRRPLAHKAFQPIRFGRKKRLIREFELIP